MATLSTMFKIQDGYTTKLNKMLTKTDKLTNSVTKASKTVDSFNKSLDVAAKSTSSVEKLGGSMVGQLGKIATATLIAKKGLDAVISGVKTANQLAKSENIFGGMLGSVDAGGAFMSHLNSLAEKSSLNLTDMAINAQSFLPLTKQVSQMDQLLNMTERLAKLNTVGQDAQGAGFALKEAMTGDFTSLAARFNVSRNSLNNSGIKEMLNAGEIDKAINTLDKLLTSAGYSNESLAAIVDNLDVSWDRFTSNMAVKFGSAMRTVTDTLNKPVQKLNEMYEAGKFDGFINLLSAGLNVVAYMVGGVVNGFIWLSEVVSNNWDIIGPMLMATAFTLLPMVISGLWGMVAPIVASAASWMLMHMPMMMVILSITGIIMSLNMMGVSFEQVFNFVGGVIGVFAAGFFNVFAGIWNVVADFINFFGNVFTNPLAAIQTLFLDWSVSILGFIEGIATGIENILNAIPGVNVSITGGITNLKNKLAAKSESIAEGAGFTNWADKLDYIDYTSAYSAGSDIGGNIYNSITSAFDSLAGIGSGIDLNLDNYLSNGALPVTNGSSGALSTSIDKDDIKYLKDLAERDYIAKFSTATLAPNITVNVESTGNKDSDDKLAARIARILDEEIAIVTRG